MPESGISLEDISRNKGADIARIVMGSSANAEPVVRAVVRSRRGSRSLAYEQRREQLSPHIARS